MTRPLDRLLRPRTIAVIGGAAARRVAEQCDRSGFEGDVWPVHPRQRSVAGRVAYASVEALPAAPDVAFVGVNRQATVACVAALSERGAGGAICYASGFREAADGGALESELVAAAGAMSIIGPNCYGLLNYLDNVPIWPDQHGGKVLGKDGRGEDGRGKGGRGKDGRGRDGRGKSGRGVAIVSQSSNIAINMTMQRRGLPLAYLLTAGNQAQLGVAELAAALLKDQRVTALGLHIEGFDSVPRLHELALAARARGVPTVVLKTGRSPQAQVAARSHTAAIAGSDAGADALLQRLGFGRVYSIAEFLETLKLLHVHGALPGGRIGAMSCSGGEASLMADAVAETRLTLPPLAADQAPALAAVVDPLVHVANPLDYHTFAWGDELALRRTFAAFVNAMAADSDANLLVLDLPRQDRCDASDWQTTLDAFHNVLASSPAKGIVVATLSENLPEECAAWLIERGIAPLGGLSEALAAVQCAADIGGSLGKPAAAPPLAVTAAVSECSGHDDEMLDEARAKAQLQAFGIHVPAGHVVRSAAEALTASRSLAGAVALKALGIAHKTERHALRLNLRTDEEIAQAASELLQLSDRLLVERLVEDVVAELIVGVHRDPSVGLLLTVGSGGIFVELAGDAITLMLPVAETEVRDAMSRLRCAPVLHGYRGRPPAAIDAAVRTVLAVADFAIARHTTLEELDVNPLAVTACDAIALDAFVRVRVPSAEHRQHRQATANAP